MGTLSIFDRFAFNGFARLSAPTSSKGMLRFALSAPDKCPFKRRQGNEQGTDWMLKFLSQEFSVWELKSCASLNRDAESLCSSPFDIAEDRSWAKLRSSMLSLMNCNSYNNRCVALVFDWTTGWLGSIIRSIQPQRNRTPWMWFFGSTRTTSDCVGSTSEVSEVESHTEAFLSFLQGTVRQPDLYINLTLLNQKISYVTGTVTVLLVQLETDEARITHHVCTLIGSTLAIAE